MPRLDPRLAGWGGVCLLLAGAVAWEWQAFATTPPPVVFSSADAPAPAASLVGAAVPLGPLAAYAAVTERPLFSQSRRPPAVDTAAPAEAARTYTVAGIVLSGSERIALLQQAGDRKLMAVHEGQALGGWTVRAILPDRVVLAGRDGETALPLRDKQGRRPGR